MNRKVSLYIGEARNRRQIINALESLGIKGATIVDSFGVWKGVSEFSYVVEIYCEETEVPSLREKAIRLKEKFNQDAVLFVVEAVQAELV